MTRQNKTAPTTVPVEEYLSTVSEKRRHEARQLIAMMEEISDQPATMWGPTMIGFGSYHYVSKSGCAGDWFKIGFSPRKAKISLYVSCDLDEFADQLPALGKHSRGKGCLYVNKLEDIDMAVLKKITTDAYVNAKDFDARNA